MIMKTKDGKVIEILFKDENGFCTCDDGWKRPINDLTVPTKSEVNLKRKKRKPRDK
ncbi:hypothetical protein D3C86_2184490 [compost metagenome]